MDVIGNNIANVNTVAYKGNSVTFSEVFYQTTQSASGPNAETGKGDIPGNDTCIRRMYHRTVKIHYLRLEIA